MPTSSARESTARPGSDVREGALVDDLTAVWLDAEALDVVDAAEAAIAAP